MFRQTQLKLTLFFSLIMGLVICILIYSFHENLEESLVIEQEAAVLGFAEEEAFEHSIFIAHGYTINSIEQAEMNAKSNSRNMFFLCGESRRKVNQSSKSGSRYGRGIFELPKELASEARRSCGDSSG
jgi:hypothetical protein